MAITVQFTDQSTPGPSGPITAWSWDFGDGGTSTSESPSHSYAAAGDYTVVLEVTGTGADGTASSTQTVTVAAPSAINAAFSFTATDLAVTFADHSTPGPSGPITGWSWNFGDSNTSTSQNPSHTYAAAGTYTVTLTVTGTSPDGTDNISHSVTVNDPVSTNSGLSGVFIPGSTPATAIRAFGTWRGAACDITQQYTGAGGSSTWSTIETPFTGSLGGTEFDHTNFMCTLSMLPGADHTQTLKIGATGGYNSHFATAAANLVAGGFGDCRIRLGHEFNLKSSNMSIWTNDTQGRNATDAAPWTSYAQYFQHIVTTMNAVTGANFTFVWSMANGWSGSGPDPALAYPGDSYVDEIWQDTYDRWYSHPGVTFTQRWNQIVYDHGGTSSPGANSRGLDYWTDFAASHSKPYGWAEWGFWDTANDTGAGGDDPSYIDAMKNYRDVVIPGKGVTFAGEMYFNAPGNSNSQIYPSTIYPNGAARYKNTWVYASSGGGTGGTTTGGGTLIFSDEFAGGSNTAPDSTKWAVYGGSNPNRWGSECFVNDRTHIYVDGSSHLVQVATYNPGGTPCTNGAGNYESGGMDTGNFPSPKFSFKYGKIEARIKVPPKSGYGMWPAFWTTGANWPVGGEIDILEIMATTGHGGYDAAQHLHGSKTGGGAWSLAHHNVSSTLWSDDFHVYGAIISSGKVQFLIDGAVTATFTPANMQTGWVWPFDDYPQKIFVDLQTGGAGGTITNSDLPQSMIVDWVRVYAP